jgi:hypothetical protein
MIGLMGGILGAAGGVRATEHVLITEFAVSPTEAEFFEIFNPTEETVDLSNYYVTDFHHVDRFGTDHDFYWTIVNGGLQPDPAFPYDFVVRFPAGASIRPGQTLVISLHDDADFTAYWSDVVENVPIDFELNQDGDEDGVADMVDPGWELIGRPFIQANVGFTNGREEIILFHWDGLSDLVQDVDMVQYSDETSTHVNLSPDKTGVEIDGPDEDDIPSAYREDTPPAQQDLASTSSPYAHEERTTISRIDFAEGSERTVDGNGISGHDETSENYSSTWMDSSPPSIGSPGEFGPPALLSAAASGSNEVILTFSRDLDPVTAADLDNYLIQQVQTGGGQIQTGIVRLPVRAARRAGGGSEVRLETGDQMPGALYEVQAEGIRSDDLSVVLVFGSRAFFRGYRPSTELRLTVPRRPYAPQLDGSIEITYAGPQGQNVLLRLFDPTGRELFVLAEEPIPPGGLAVLTWDGRDPLRQRLPAGIYYLHLANTATGDETVAPIVVGLSTEGTSR